MESLLSGAISILPGVSEHGVLATISVCFLAISICMVGYFIKRTKQIDDFLLEKKKDQTNGQTDQDEKTNGQKSELKEVLEKIDVLADRVSTIETILKDEKREEEQRQKQKSNLPVDQMDLGNKTNELLRETLEKIKADRLDVFIFSNGKISTNGMFEFLKFNHSFMYQRSGTELEPLQEIPFTFLSSFFTALYKHKVVFMNSDTKSKKYDPIVKTWIDKTKADCSVFALIKGKEDLAGFAVASYDSESSVIVDERKTAGDMKMLVSKLEVLLG